MSASAHAHARLLWSRSLTELDVVRLRLMIITGIITFITSILFWSVLPSMLRGCGAYSTRDRRFFFPDSPATAWFLTPEERVIAIERIKVNQAGVENKHFKLDQCVSFFTDRMGGWR